MSTQKDIEEFILNELLSSGDRTSIGPDEPLISSGVVDSLALLRLIPFLEESLGLVIGDGEVVPENFDTLRKISDFVDAKRAQ